MASLRDKVVYGGVRFSRKEIHFANPRQKALGVRDGEAVSVYVVTTHSRGIKYPSQGKREMERRKRQPHIFHKLVDGIPVVSSDLPGVF